MKRVSDRLIMSSIKILLSVPIKSILIISSLHLLGADEGTGEWWQLVRFMHYEGDMLRVELILIVVLIVSYFLCWISIGCCKPAPTRASCYYSRLCMEQVMGRASGATS